MAFDHLYSNAPIERELTYRGKTEAFHFKRMTAGERIEMRRGNIGTVKGGEATVTLDLSEADKRNAIFLFYVVCKPDGKRVFKNVAEVHDLPGDLLDALVKLANDALEETAEGNA